MGGGGVERDKNVRKNEKVFREKKISNHIG
jgi:hypothetical protein